MNDDDDGDDDDDDVIMITTTTIATMPTTTAARERVIHTDVAIEDATTDAVTEKEEARDGETQ